VFDGGPRGSIEMTSTANGFASQLMSHRESFASVATTGTQQRIVLDQGADAGAAGRGGADRAGLLYGWPAGRGSTGIGAAVGSRDARGESVGSFDARYY